MGVALKKSDLPTAPADEARDLLLRLDGIPTLPLVAMKVNELISSPTSTNLDIADALRKDQVLTAKVLKLVNSSYYSIPKGVTDIQKALSFLGFNTVAQLVLSLSVFSVFTHSESDEFSLTDFWRHALGVAVGAETIARKIRYAKPQEAFTCGLLHDIGKLALHQLDNVSFFKILSICAKNKRSFLETEIEEGFPGHAVVGEVLAQKWGLPKTISDSILHHHDLVSKDDGLPEESRMTVRMVRLANWISLKNKIGKSGDFSEVKISERALGFLGLKLSDIPELEAIVLKDMEKAGAFLSANG